jgi:hypothetical protein
MGEVEIGRLKAFVAKQAKIHGFDEQSLDVVAHYDSKLTYQENKAHIKKLIGSQISEVIDDFKSWSERNEAQAQENRNEHIKAEEERILSEMKTETNQLGSFYQQLHDYISVLSGSEKIHGLIILGSPSIGKTRQVLSQIDNAVVLAGHITPLSLFKTIYENSDKNIVIDDPTTLLESQDSVGILLQALQTEKTRIVQWLSTHLAKLDMLTKTPFSGKIVIVANSIPKEMDVLLSRCLLRRIAFSVEERAKLLVAFSKQEGITLEISEYALKLCNKANSDRVNFRLLLKANEFHRKSLDWKEFLMESLEVDEVLKVLLDLEHEPISVKDKVEKFKEITGLSRASYFRLKGELNKGGNYG